MGWDASRGFSPSSAVLKWLWNSLPSSQPSTQNWLLLHTCSSIGLMCSHGNKVCYLRDLSEISWAAFILPVRPQCFGPAQVTCQNVKMHNTCSLKKIIVNADNQGYVFKLSNFIKMFDENKLCLFLLTFKNFYSLEGDGMENRCSKCVPWKHFYNKCILELKRSSSPSLFPNNALVSLEMWRKALNIQ